MKKSTLIIAVLGLAMSFTACDNCVTCGSCNDGVTVSSEEICESDAPSKDDFDAAIAILESDLFGCTCS